MEENKVVPDVIDAVPAAVLEVKFGSVSANNGNELKPKQVKNPPEVNWAADPNKYYLICMTG